MSSGNPIRNGASFFILSAFILYILSSGITNQLSLMKGYISSNKNPDFGQYIHTETLALSTHKKQHRVIVVGDIHGQYDYFQDLLAKLHYDEDPHSSQDTLIHVGDITVKGTLSGSLQVLTWMAHNNITGVRGNHDQDVISWKNWQDWIRETKVGKQWLDDLERSWERETNLKGHRTAREWLEKQRKNTWKEHKSWWKRIPEGWEMFGEHYLIASSLDSKQHQYLLSLPLVLHVPEYHTFIAHAGLLASDPKHPLFSSKQPLSHLPKLPKGEKIKDHATLRKLHELALLKDIPQNQDPWTVLNIRSLLRDNTVSRKGKKGTPWSVSWNNIMNRCSGYDHAAQSSEEIDPSSAPLPCLPSSIIYGHAAARGLDIHRWSFGLDTGCAYGRRLTALVLERASGSHPSSDKDEDASIYLDGMEDEDEENELDDETDEDDYSRSRKRSPKRSSIRFGDQDERLATAYLANVKCR